MIKKWLTIILLSTGMVILTYFSLNWFLRNHTQATLEKLIMKETSGKVKVKIPRINLSIFENYKLGLHNTNIVILDDTKKKPAYVIDFKYLGIELESLKKFLFNRQLSVNYIIAVDPEVKVFQQKGSSKHKETKKISEEIGDIALAIRKIGTRIQVNRFGVFNGLLSIQSSEPDQLPVKLNGISFQADDFLLAADQNTTNRNNLSVYKLKLSIGPQDIIFPNGKHRLKFSSFEINSIKNSVLIEDFQFFSADSLQLSSKLQGSFRKLKLVNFDFHSIFENTGLQADSLYCTDPQVNLTMDITRDTLHYTKSNLPIEKRIAALIGNCNLKYLGFLNSDITFTTYVNRKPFHFTSHGNNFEAVSIKIDSSARKPVDIGRLNISIKNYETFTKDSLYAITFDSVVYRTGYLNLKNLKLTPTGLHHHNHNKFVLIPDFELRDFSIGEMITTKTFKAKSLTLQDIRVINTIHPPEQTNRKKPDIHSILQSVTPHLNLEKIIIRNGTIVLTGSDPSFKLLSIKGLTGEIRSNEMLHLTHVAGINNVVQRMDFKQLSFTGNSYKIKMVNGFIQASNRIGASSLELILDRNKSYIRLSDPKITDYVLGNDLHSFRIGQIGWKDAIIHLKTTDRPENVKETFANQGKIPDIRIEKVLGNKTHLDFGNEQAFHGAVTFSSIVLNGLNLENNKPITFTGLSASGENLMLQSADLNIRSAAFSVNEAQSSIFKNVVVQQLKNADTVYVAIPHVSVIPELVKSIKNKYPVIRSIAADSPEALLVLKNHGQGLQSKKKKPLPIQIDRLTLKQAGLRYSGNSQTGSLKVAAGPFNVEMTGINQSLTDSSASVQELKFDAQHFSLNKNDSIHLTMDDGTFQLKTKWVRLSTDKMERRLNAHIDKIHLKNLGINYRLKNGKDPLVLAGVNMGADHLQIDSLDKMHVFRQILKNPFLYVSGINLRQRIHENELALFGLDYMNAAGTISIDSFYYTPLTDKESFSAIQKWQKIYPVAKSGKVTIRNINIEKLLHDSTLEIQALQIRTPDVFLYKDKRVPFREGITKPLPTNLLKTVQRKLKIDSIRIYDGTLIYEELNDKTNRTGLVYFNKINSLIRGIKTHDHQTFDSLDLFTYAIMQDSIKLRLHVDQSYYDSLSAFRLGLQISPFQLPDLNPILEPLVSARINKGYLDTLQLRAIGREYIAHGKMKMLYRDLSVEYLNKKDQSRKKLSTRVINFLARTLIHKKNADQSGIVFAERVRDKGFINYWIKIVMSGALTNTGIRTDNKQEKRYKRALRREHVPEIPEMEL